jgi:hypothetical protein
MSTVTITRRGNVQVTVDTDSRNDRSESDLAVNPLDPNNMVGASKRFTDPATYAFSLAAYYTFDGGLTWTEAPTLTLRPDWAGTSDPAVAWDSMGNAYLVTLPFGTGADTPLIGIAVYKSSDGGRTWSEPDLIHASSGDDKQWALGDNDSGSPFFGNLYAAWDDGAGIGASSLSFARTTDQGASWKGIKVSGRDSPAGTHLHGVHDSGAPELSVAADGTIYIVWVTDAGEIKFVKSTDGGDSFSAPRVVASGISVLPSHLPGGKFRTFSPPTGTTGSGANVIFAWADFREGVSRIYYRRSTDGGVTWQGPSSGQPLLTGAAASAADQHDFDPQLVTTPRGEMACAFYSFGPKGNGGSALLIDVILAVSTDDGVTFPNRVTVTERPWDPTVDEVFAHGDPQVTFIGDYLFIGDYFGLTASPLGIFPFWTDTRTGIQEIFTDALMVMPLAAARDEPI